MKALIDTLETVNHIVDWVLDPNWDGKNPNLKYTGVYEIINNAARVCEVQANDFPVAEPLFWVDCANDVVTDEFYFDTETQTIKPIVNAPMPE
jgi:hypothetical protein